MDTAKLLDELGIVHDVDKKHMSRNGLSVKCPFCDDPSYHGSFHRLSLYYKCWRCKGGTGIEALRLLSQRPVSVIYDAIKNSGGSSTAAVSTKRTFADEIKIPGGDLMPYHRKYLERRGFDPDFLVRKYGIRGTSPFSDFEGLNFRNRIIIPVYDLSGRLISFQGRDITGNSPMRYKFCPLEKSLMNFKETVYAGNLALGRKVVVVEGVFDAWKLGPGAVATYGTSMTDAQVLTLTNWNEVVFLFDPEPEAQRKANEYAQRLAFLGVNAYVAYEDFGNTPNGKKRDVGDLAPHEIARIRSELGI